MRALLSAFAAIALCSCGVPTDTAHDALEAYGFTDIQIGSPAVFGCAEDDTFASEFTAKNPNGIRVKGVVCAGAFKGATVRITGRA